MHCYIHAHNESVKVSNGPSWFGLCSEAIVILPEAAISFRTGE